MPNRCFLGQLFSFCVAICAAPHATAAELPKDGTCRLKVKLEAQQTLDQLSAARDGILSWDEKETITNAECDRAQWPSMRGHCFGSGELDGKFAISTGYCIDTDQDGDKIVWKLPATKYNQYSSTSSYSSDVLMANGKYKGLSGTSKWHCVYSGTFAVSVGDCNVEMTFKFP